MEKKQITYLFGAGASCQSMPMVANFVSRFENYTYFLAHHIGNIAGEFIQENEAFIKSVKSHLSFDTFFKKLFHLDRQDEIIRFKAFLNLYFYFEHVVQTSEISTYIEKYKDYGKEYSLDPRYEALIAGLLKPIKGDAKFYNDVTFITWNYDLNLLYAIFNFVRKGVSFAEFINRLRTSDNYFQITDQLKVIHLNGYVYDRKITEFGSISLNQLKKDLSERMLGINSGDELRDYGTSIKFAWEDGLSEDKQSRFLQEAVDAISHSHSIIVTGYSFPLYNRIVDKVMFRRENLDRSVIYIRDPRASEIKESFHADFGIALREDSPVSYIGQQFEPPPEVLAGTFCNNFFIPPNIYS